MRLLGTTVCTLVLVGCFSPDRSTPGLDTDAGTDGSSETDSNSDSPSSTNPSSTVGQDESSTGSDPTDPSDTDDTDDTSAPACNAPDGTIDSACPDAAPFCESGTCTPCTSLPVGSCESAEPATPACDASGACLPCSEHEQCSSGACRIAQGTCFPDGNRLWVDNTAGDCNTATGTQNAPFCSLTQAVDVVIEQPGTSAWAIFVAGTATPYSGTIAGYHTHPIAIIGAKDGLATRLTHTSGSTVDKQSQVPEMYLAHLRISTNGGQRAVRCTSGAMWIDDSQLDTGNFGDGIDAGNCEVTVRRTSITNNGRALQSSTASSVVMLDTIINDNAEGMYVRGQLRFERSRISNSYVGGGIELDGGSASATIVNSFLYANVYAIRSLNASNGASFEVLYSTIDDSATCDAAAPGTRSIRNSIVVGWICSNALVEYSAVTEGAGQGDGNVTISHNELADIFVNPGGFQADYRLRADADAVADVAVWRDGDPQTDFYGSPRPDTDGATDYPGAHIP